jgi:hypothetical protein
MKKFAVSISSAVLFALSGQAFAMPGSAVLADVVARTDARLAAFVPAAADLPQIEAPAPVRTARTVQLTDVTDKYTKNGEVVTSYPAVYPQVPKEENSLIIKVFRFTARDGAERKIEVFLTGGDWMQYALIYFVTNAGPDKNKASAYFMPRLSTPDRENGSVAPEIDPQDTQKVAAFIVNEFLDGNGNLKTGYTSIASATAAD